MPTLKDYIFEAINSGKNKYPIEWNELEIGDKVRVKSKEEIEAMCKHENGRLKYYFNIGGTNRKRGATLFVSVPSDMLELCGKICTVTSIDKVGLPYIVLNDRGWAWHPDFLERL